MTVKAEPAVQGAQTLLRALDILDCLSGEDAAQPLGELSRRVGLKPSTTHRLLKALASRGMVIGDADGRYRLGPGIVRLSSAVMRRASDLIAVAMPAMERIRSLTGETVSLHCLLGETRICVGELVSPEPIRMESGVGSVYPLHAGAAGKAILAWRPDLVDRISTSLTAVGPATIVDADELARELDRIRRRGWAASEGEVVAGAASLAVPILGPAGEAVAAINVAGPASRWNRRQIARVREDVVKEAGAVSARIAPAGV